MPLVDCADSTLVVVDAQQVFFDQRTMTAAEREQGAAFEWLRTVEDATRTLRAVEQRFGPPLRL